MKPDPHPLDFDWRYNEDTVTRLVELSKPSMSLLAIGSPSIVELAEGKNVKTLLVDRQPAQSVKNHLLKDVNINAPLMESFDCIYLDPPWYLPEMFRWVSWAAQSCAYRGVIYLSLWPEETRPSAVEEREKLFDWLDEWASYETHLGFLTYEMPRFEHKASQVTNIIPDEKEWRKGDLVVIRPDKLPELHPTIDGSEIWHRFIINNYQLAVRIDKYTGGDVSLEKHHDANGWNWPSVSKRAIGRELINIWSSDNEVGIINGTSDAIVFIQKVLGVSSDNSDFSGDFTSLGQWNLPKKPYERVIEWVHQS
ncbi:hypothetical protein [Enterovibrio sp. FF113]|uniref:hypothetical protein n=1 Tax=Enterovibrio sp. FF113 TaxID=3230010 RepID=UPI00352E1037